MLGRDEGLVRHAGEVRSRTLDLNSLRHRQENSERHVWLLYSTIVHERVEQGLLNCTGRTGRRLAPTWVLLNVDFGRLDHLVEHRNLQRDPSVSVRCVSYCGREQSYMTDSDGQSLRDLSHGKAEDLDVGPKCASKKVVSPQLGVDVELDAHAGSGKPGGRVR